MTRTSALCVAVSCSEGLLLGRSVGENRNKHKRCARLGSDLQCVTNNLQAEAQRKSFCFKVFQFHVVVHLVCITCHRICLVFGWTGLSCQCFLPQRSLHSSRSHTLASQSDTRGRKDDLVNIRTSKCIVCENRNCFEAVVHERVGEVEYLLRTGPGPLPRADVKVVFLFLRLCSFHVLVFRCNKNTSLSCILG